MDIQTIQGWSGGAKMRGKLPVPGRLTNLDYNRPIVLPVGAVRGCLDIFLPSITSLFFFPFSGRRSDID